MANPVPVSMGRGSNAARQGLSGLAMFENAYVEDLGESGKTSFTAQCINGWRLFATLETGDVSKQVIVDELLLAACGPYLYSVSYDGNIVTKVGGLPGTGNVSMAVNRKTPEAQVAIVRSGLWYIFEGGILTQGTDADLPPPLFVLEILGYFVFLIEDGRWFISANNGATIDALDFAEAEASADKNVAGAVRGRTLIIMGERSTEFWDVNGDATFPFGFTAAINLGCYAASSVANFNLQQGNSVQDTVIWAATDRKGAYAGVVALSGYTPTIISTAEVDRLIRDEPDKTTISAMSWTEDGHPFYAISGSSFTRTYDGKTGEWHGRRSHNKAAWNGLSHTHFRDKVIFGHRTNGKLYESLATLKDEAGEPIVYRIQPPPITMWPRRFQVDAVYIDMVAAPGLVSTDSDAENPKVFIDYSKDGGISWGPQRQYELGKVAQAFRRIIARTLGRFDHNGLTLRITCSANVYRALQQLAVEVEMLEA